MKRPPRKATLFIVALLLLVVSNIQGQLYLLPRHKAYVKAQSKERAPGRQFSSEESMGESSFGAAIAMLFGIRQVAASVLWIRADDFFHRGEYGPIIKLVHLITVIDPHQLDVYATGAWHMAYNFMDKRLIPDGVHFLEEGCRNNPDVYDLFFELGYMHRDKTHNFPEAYRYYTIAATKPRSDGHVEAPTYVNHQRAHVLSLDGNVDASIEQWRQNLEYAQQHAGDDGKFRPGGVEYETVVRNLYIQERRRNERAAGIALRRGDRERAKELWQANVKLCDLILKHDPREKAVRADRARAIRNVARIEAGTMPAPRIADLKFNPHWRRVAPRKIEIYGTIDCLDFARVDFEFQDRNYDEIASKKIDFKMANGTREVDRIQVKNQKFSWIMELDKDPAGMDRPPSDIYPLKSDEYVLYVRFNPRRQSPSIQDLYGWNGENLTDSKYLKVDKDHPGIIFGEKVPLRYLEKRFIIKRSELL